MQRAAWVVLFLVLGPVAGAGAEPLLELSDQIAQRVAALRGLPVLEPIRRGVMTRDQILARVQKLVAAQYLPDEIRREGQVLARLGLVPPGTDYEQTMYGLLREQVAGFYDPHARELYLASWIEPGLQVATLSHEIEHALQDQHFHIGQLLERRPGESDRQSAMSALCEGDGLAVMIDAMMSGSGRTFLSQPDIAAMLRTQAAGSGEQPLLRAAPRALREMLLFPYLAGIEFVRHLRLRGGPGGAPAPWSAVDAAFRSPPDSTEQILHPERYLRRDRPVVVRVPASATLSRAYSAVYRDTLGEFALRLYLEETVPERAAAAAAGWGGDGLVLHERRSARRGRARAGRPPDLSAVALQVRVHWDRPEDAEEFLTVATRALERRFPHGTAVVLPGGAGRSIGGGLASGLLRRGDDVAWVEGVPEASLPAVLSETLR